MKWWKRSLTNRRHRSGILRVAAYMGVLGLGTGVFHLHRAHAMVQEQTVEVGREMLTLAQANKDHEVTKVTLNAQPAYLGRSVSTDTVKNVLDRYEAHCNANLGQEASVEAWRALATSPDVPDKGRGLGLGVLRGGGDNEGTVVCFTKSAQSKPSFLEAAKAFGETGELGAIGNLRYVLARKTERGNTTVLTVWTEGRFNLAELMPKPEGDASGVDFDGIPRPPNAQRIFSARGEGTPFGVNVYKTKDDPSGMPAFYNAALIKEGWASLDPKLEQKSDENREHHATGRLYEKGGMVLTMTAHAEKGETYVGLGIAGVNQAPRAFVGEPRASFDAE